MIKSMTAYGRFNSIIDGRDITVEIKSVNNRYLDCTVRIPRRYSYLEDKVRNYVQNNGISRGKVDVSITIFLSDGSGTEVALDDIYTASYIAALRKLRDDYHLSDDISVMTVARNSDIFNAKKPDEDTEKEWKCLVPVLDGALEAYTKTKEAEGENLRTDLLIKLNNLRSLAEKLNSRSSLLTGEYNDRLHKKLISVLDGLDVNIDEGRILTECAIYSDRVAIDEELVRLDSHFGAFEKMLDSDTPIGRKMDFQLQEMNREVNTSGSKINDFESSKIVVEMKSELEKIREQIQNIE